MNPSMGAERMDGAGEVKNVLREEMADERRRLKEEHAAQQEARRLKREAEQQRRAEAAANGQVCSPLLGHYMGHIRCMLVVGPSLGWLEVARP